MWISLVYPARPCFYGDVALAPARMNYPNVANLLDCQMIIMLLLSRLKVGDLGITAPTQGGSGSRGESAVDLLPIAFLQ